MSFDLRQPATEVEVAEAIQTCDGITRVTVRRLAFERDALRALLADLRVDIAAQHDSNDCLEMCARIDAALGRTR